MENPTFFSINTNTSSFILYFFPCLIHRNKRVTLIPNLNFWREFLLYQWSKENSFTKISSRGNVLKILKLNDQDIFLYRAFTFHYHLGWIPSTQEPGRENKLPSSNPPRTWSCESMVKLLHLSPCLAGHKWTNQPIPRNQRINSKIRHISGGIRMFTYPDVPVKHIPSQMLIYHGIFQKQRQHIPKKNRRTICKIFYMASW